MQTNFAYPIMAQYLTNCMLNVTDDCNLQCRYCFVEQHPHYMTLDVAKATADWLHNNLIKKKKMGHIPQDEKAMLYFFGGEPLLCYDSIIIPVVKYCQEKYPGDFEHGITTNGTLLNKERIQFLKDNEIPILLSIDGIKEVQEYNRPCKDCKLSSFEMIEKNIPDILKAFPLTTFRSTIYAPTVEYLYENYLYAESLGFQSYEIIPDARHEKLWTEDKIQILKNEMAKIYAHRLERAIAHLPNMHWYYHDDWLCVTTYLYSNKEIYDIENQLSVQRCGLGTTSGAVAWDGNIYGCQEQPSKDNKNIFLIGNVFDGGIDIQKHYKLLNYYFQQQRDKEIIDEKCQNCGLKQICRINYKGCPSTNFDLYKCFDIISNINCQMKKIYFNNSLLVMKIIFELKDEKLIKDLLTIVQQNDYPKIK